MPFSTHSDIRLPADLIGLWLRRHYCEDLQRVQSWSRSGYCCYSGQIYKYQNSPKKLYSLLAPPLVLHPNMIDFCVFIVLVLLTIFLYFGKSLF